MLDMVILALRTLRQEDHEFDAILGYILKPDQVRPNHTMLRKGKVIHFRLQTQWQVMEF